MRIGIVSGENPKAHALEPEIKNYILEKGGEIVGLPKEAEVVIVLGGDGTLIHEACDNADLDTVYFGINVGTLGFLTAAEGNNWKEAVDKLLSGNYVVSERMTLEVVSKAGSKKIDFRALNEVVVKGIYRVVDLDIFVSGEKFMNIIGDGVIVSSQTGSTAYSLSAGGPIVDPSVDCILINPINAHGLPVPSVVLSPKDEVEIVVNKGNDISLIIDGKEHEQILENDRLLIKCGEFKVKLGYFDNKHFLKALNKKFGLLSRPVG